MQRQTTLVKPNETTKKWYIVDAANKPLGRLASEVAVILMGKDKPSYTPNVDCGDYVIVINASKVSLSGNKLKDKYYYRVSGWTGGLKKRSAGEMLQTRPCEMIEKSVKGMIPHTSLGRKMGKKLFVYADDQHKHEAQKPVVKELKF